MLVYRSLAAAAIFGGMLLVGCDEPNLPTNLRTDGPPNVTTVVVMSDLSTDNDPPDRAAPLSRYLESATYCRLNDDKRPGIIGLPTATTTQICPEDLKKAAETDGTALGAPPVWFVRVVFDELLDNSVEELIPEMDAMGNPTGTTLGSLKNTQPVSLKCGGVAVPYDGYYAPNGNKISWPLGPALFIQPNDPTVAKTGESCEVALLGPVKNKRGQAVSEKSSFNFKIAPLAYRFSFPDPEDQGGDDGQLEQDTGTPALFYFNASLQTAVAAADIKIFSGPNGPVVDGQPTPNAAVCGGGGTPVAAVAAVDGDDDLIMDVADATATDAWALNTTYRIELTPTAHVTAVQGSVDPVNEGKLPATYKVCFHTPAM